MAISKGIDIKSADVRSTNTQFTDTGLHINFRVNGELSTSATPKAGRGVLVGVVFNSKSGPIELLGATKLQKR